MHAPRDDRVLRGTRVVAALVVPFLLAAFGLWIVPSRTDWFAWTIRPDMTPMVMGAGYVAGAFFFARVLVARCWHRVHLGFLPVTTFTIFMAVATLRNLDRFDHGRAAFWVWAGLYAATPVVVPAAWAWNRRRDPRELAPGDVRLPDAVRLALAAAGVGQLVVALVLLVSPSTMIDVWPWTVSPLTAAVLGGWFALPGVVALMMAIDARWGAIRVTLDSQLLGLALILAAVGRAWDDFDRSNALTYVFTAGIALLLLALLALRIGMDRRRCRPAETARAARASHPTTRARRPRRW
ncbi:MAG: hypothetical protein R3C15_07240 [Thermoleophilia bacterium]